MLTKFMRMQIFDLKLSSFHEDFTFHFNTCSPMTAVGGEFISGYLVSTVMSFQFSTRAEKVTHGYGFLH
jgi:hypothetical protein